MSSNRFINSLKAPRVVSDLECKFVHSDFPEDIEMGTGYQVIVGDNNPITFVSKHFELEWEDESGSLRGDFVAALPVVQGYLLNDEATINPFTKDTPKEIADLAIFASGKLPEFTDDTLYNQNVFKPIEQYIHLYGELPTIKVDSYVDCVEQSCEHSRSVASTFHEEGYTIDTEVTLDNHGEITLFEAIVEAKCRNDDVDWAIDLSLAGVKSYGDEGFSASKDAWVNDRDDIENSGVKMLKEEHLATIKSLNAPNGLSNDISVGTSMEPRKKAPSGLRMN